MPDRFATSIRILAQEGDLRVWSVIVSIFGDLAQAQGDVITSGLLSQITTFMGIKSQALRVALHRLRKDGWIESLKSGRTSAYRLTARGYGESFAARTRIYSAAPTEPGHWTLLISRARPQAERMIEEKHLRNAGYVPIATGVYLGHADAELPGFLVIDCNINRIPDWLRAETIPPQVGSEIAGLDRTLAKILDILGDRPALTPLETATLRILIVHNWRRSVLRLPDLPDRFFPTDWRGEACRDKVRQLLERLERPALAELQGTAPAMLCASA